MSKVSSTRRTSKLPPATEVGVEIRITIKEVHSRTYTTCDKQSRSLHLDLGHDFEAASDWLLAEETWDELERFCWGSRKVRAPRTRNGS